MLEFALNCQIKKFLGSFIRWVKCTKIRKSKAFSEPKWNKKNSMKNFPIAWMMKNRHRNTSCDLVWSYYISWSKPVTQTFQPTKIEQGRLGIWVCSAMWEQGRWWWWCWSEVVLSTMFHIVRPQISSTKWDQVTMNAFSFYFRLWLVSMCSHRSAFEWLLWHYAIICVKIPSVAVWTDSGTFQHWSLLFVFVFISGFLNVLVSVFVSLFVSGMCGADLFPGLGEPCGPCGPCGLYGPCGSYCPGGPDVPDYPAWFSLIQPVLMGQMSLMESKLVQIIPSEMEVAPHPQNSWYHKEHKAF